MIVQRRVSSPSTTAAACRFADTLERNKVARPADDARAWHRHPQGELGPGASQVVGPPSTPRNCRHDLVSADGHGSSCARQPVLKATDAAFSASPC
jgi:hypothetical protein